MIFCLFKLRSISMDFDLDRASGVNFRQGNLSCLSYSVETVNEQWWLTCHEESEASSFVATSLLRKNLY